MALISKNPATGQILAEIPELTDEQLQAKLELAAETYKIWRNTNLDERKVLVKKLAEELRKDAKNLARLATEEMGKTISQGLAEVEKCAWVCDYYAENVDEFLRHDNLISDASESFVRFDPLGVILAVMPWNFPFLQVIRFAIPVVLVGNVGVLKHASNVARCAIALEQVFLNAGFPEGVFQNLSISSKKVEQVVRHKAVKAVALTGSEGAGSQVAALAGSLIKKTVLELGGSDPFIVLEDADLEAAAQHAAKGRLQNCGQSCIAAKRFIVVEKVYDEFLEKFKNYMEMNVVGDPMNEKTEVGPLSSMEGLELIAKQVQESLKMGAKLITGGRRVGEVGAFYAPTILANLSDGMPAYNQEIFGPVASLIKVKDEKEAIEVANSTPYGLGSSIWTNDKDRAKKIAAKINSGMVFVNGITKSDPRLPFGGIGMSGYGRELSGYGIKEFVNVKTVWIK